MNELIPTGSQLDATAKRFWSKVCKHGPNGCWLWVGKRLVAGYGQFYLNGDNKYAHRIAYTWEVAEIPDGFTIDHVVCDNPPCVNPAHMVVATQQQNILRSSNPAAKNARKTHCIRGHEFTEENTYAVKYDGGAGVGRECRQCRRENARLRYHGDIERHREYRRDLRSRNPGPARAAELKYKERKARNEQ